MNARGTFFLIMLLAFSLLPSLQAQSFSPGGALVIRDSTGQVVGQSVGLGPVSVIINNHTVVLFVQRTRLTDFGEGLYFAQPNCQGTAYINLATVPFITYTPGEFAPDGTVRVSPSFTPTSRAVNSRYTDQTQQCTNQNLTIQALDTEVGPNLKAQFSAPFAASAAPSAVPVNSIGFLLILVSGLAIFGVIRIARS